MDRENEILELLSSGMSRLEIASRYYNGDKSNNLKCLNKFMKRRGYVIVEGKYAKENTYGIPEAPTTILQKDSKVIQKELNVVQDKKDVCKKDYCSNTEIENMEKRIHNLEEKYDELVKILRTCNEVAVTVEGESDAKDIKHKMEINLPEAPDIKMSSWVNGGVWDEWKQFTDAYKHYGKKYLISQALLNFIKENK